MNSQLKRWQKMYSGKWNEKADRVREHARFVYNGEEI